MSKRTNIVREIDKRIRRAEEETTPIAIGGGTVLTTKQHRLDGPEHTEATGTSDKLATVDHSGLLLPLSGDDADRLAGDGTWIAGGGGGHTIQENGTPLTARTNINFQDGIVATDDAGNDQTDVSLDFGEDADISTQAFGDTPSAGASLEVAGAGHKHGMPSLTDALSAKASATADYTPTTTSAVDVTGATLSLAAGTYIVVGNFDVTRNGATNDRTFEGVLDVNAVDENDLAVWTPLGTVTVRDQVLQVWRVVLASTLTVKLQARHSGGTAGDFTVNAANTTLTAYRAGGTGTPVFVGAHAYHSTTQSIPDNAFTSLNLDSERFDSDAFHDVTTNNSRLTVPAGKAGKYLIGGNASLALNATGQRGMRIWLNGTTRIADVTEPTPGSTLNSRMHASVLYALAVGDYVELQVFQNSTAALLTQQVANSLPEFWMTLVGV